MTKCSWIYVFMKAFDSGDILGQEEYIIEDHDSVTNKFFCR